jgi:hypothetical protein
MMLMMMKKCSSSLSFASNFLTLFLLKIYPNFSGEIKFKKFLSRPPAREPTAQHSRARRDPNRKPDPIHFSQVSAAVIRDSVRATCASL